MASSTLSQKRCRNCWGSCWSSQCCPCRGRGSVRLIPPQYREPLTRRLNDSTTFAAASELSCHQHKRFDADHSLNLWTCLCACCATQQKHHMHLHKLTDLRPASVRSRRMQVQMLWSSLFGGVCQHTVHPHLLPPLLVQQKEGVLHNCCKQLQLLRQPCTQCASQHLPFNRCLGPTSSRSSPAPGACLTPNF